MTTALRDLLSGKKPSSTNVNPVGTPVSSSTSASSTVAGSGGGSAIATAALSYQGHPYVYGGDEANPGGWDCSSFVNWVIGHDMGMAIPGYAPGAYNGSVHGPPTGMWLLWGGATTIARDSLLPGDLLVWPTHMGICIGSGANAQMISALDPADGTKVTSIAGGSPTGEPLFCKRLTAAAVLPASGGIFPTPSGTAPLLIGQAA